MQDILFKHIAKQDHTNIVEFLGSIEDQQVPLLPKLYKDNLSAIHLCADQGYREGMVEILECYLARG